MEKEVVFEEGGREGCVMAFLCFSLQVHAGADGKLGNWCSCIPWELPKLGLLQPQCAAPLTDGHAAPSLTLLQP